ncbi:MAG: response regulator, partial [Gemmatimonadetes bacterium]|nr:response regulator [Gemmatimonadota bacterium]
QLEEKLRQTQKLEAIGKLAGGIAHDFNNLLTVITSYSELVLSELPEEAPNRADIEGIRRAADSAAALTRQLLAFGRRQVLQPRNLDLNGVVAAVESMLRRIIGERITLVFDPGQNVGTVRADPGQLEQVLMNLVVNARDAMPEGGTLRLATSRLAPSHAGAGDFVRLTVSDTGTGMDGDTIARAFEPFFTTKPPGEGTGLGLPTVHGIVTQSGGRIEVDSTPGDGTTFRIYLPAVDAQAQEPEESPAAPVAARTASGTILLVEDEEAVRLIVRRTLTRQGYDVVEACNGEEALRILKTRSEDIDLILTDLVMPEMGGRTLVIRVREQFTNPPPVVYMSGYAEEDALPADDFGGGDVLLEKPFTIQELLAVVGRAVGLRNQCGG